MFGAGPGFDGSPSLDEKIDDNGCIMLEEVDSRGVWRGVRKGFVCLYSARSGASGAPAVWSEESSDWGTRSDGEMVSYSIPAGRFVGALG